MYNWAIYWTVTTCNINADWTYILNVESSSSDVEYRNCLFVQQPWINTFPKVWDTVLLFIVGSGEYAVLWVVSYNAKQYFSLWDNEEFTIKEATWIDIGNGKIKMWATDITLVATTITANWENLIIDNV